MTDTFASDLRFYVNGQLVVIENADPTVLLVDWLRSPDVGLTGTKKGCDQGGCGACTVMLSRWDDATKTVERKSINSCLRPICALDGMEIMTTEGTGSARTKISPVQYRIAKDNGTQCGYSTPGFVMNMYSFLAARKGRPATQEEIENIFDGNVRATSTASSTTTATSATTSASTKSRKANATGPATTPGNPAGDRCRVMPEAFRQIAGG